MNAKGALLGVKGVVGRFGDSKAVHSCHLEFDRRLEVLKLIEEYCEQGSMALDLDAQPFIISCAHRKMGYNVTAFDVDPEPYMKIALIRRMSELVIELTKNFLYSTHF